MNSRKKQERRAKNRAKYAKNHDSKYSKNGKKLGRPRKRKNEKFEPEMVSNGETKLDLLTHERYPLLERWEKNVDRSHIRELISVRDTIMEKKDYVLNYFNNRSTNASAESFNSKLKGFRAQVRGGTDMPVFMYRTVKIFG